MDRAGVNALMERSRPRPAQVFSPLQRASFVQAEDWCSLRSLACDTPLVAGEGWGGDACDGSPFFGAPKAVTLRRRVNPHFMPCSPGEYVRTEKLVRSGDGVTAVTALQAIYTPCHPVYHISCHFVVYGGRAYTQ